LWRKTRILVIIEKVAGFTSQEDRLMLRATTDQRTDRTHDSQPCVDDPAGLVAARLRRSGYPFLRSVHCEVREDVMVLSGTVPTFHLKQIAQELAVHTPGVRQIENRLHVTSSTFRARRSAAAG
jgi:osmotically-inducible protein OsmY